MTCMGKVNLDVVIMFVQLTDSNFAIYLKLT